MDPNALLARLRDLSARILNVQDGSSEETLDEDDAFALAEGFQNLDDWLRKGGFSPWGAK